MIDEIRSAAEELPMQTRSGMTIRVFILTILPTVISAQSTSTPLDRFPGTFTPASPSEVYVSANVDASAEYGLGPRQAIPEIEVKLTVKRNGTPANLNDVVGRADHAIATARTGPAGGVTFPNVPPGSYVIVFQIIEWAALVADVNRANPTKIAWPPHPIVKYTSGYEWRAFPDAGYQYAIRAPNLVFKAQELRRSRDKMANRVIAVAQEFELTGSAPVAVRAAIGYMTPAR